MSEYRQGGPDPETFHDIQDDATGSILRMLPLLVVLYSLSIGLIVIAVTGTYLAVEAPSMVYESGGWFRQNWVWLFAVSGVVGLISAPLHALYAYMRSTDSLVTEVGGMPLDQDDRYHHTLQNVVEEIGLAAGINDLQARVIPTARTNALAVGDKDHAVVLITEGALGRLRRDELLAVVAHEVAHIAYGDSRLKFFTANIINTFDLVSSSLAVSTGSSGSGNRRRYGVNTSGRGGGGALLALVVLFVLSTLLKTLNHFLSTMISQQREWRADATAVEYCRDPLALASGLHKLGQQEALGSEETVQASSYTDTLNGPGYEPLLLVPFEAAREEHRDVGWLEQLFSSHPPLHNRIEKALKLGHAPFSELKSRLDKERSSPHFPVRALRDESGEPLRDQSWWIRQDGENQQLSLTQLLTGGVLSEDALVAREGEEEWSRPAEHEELGTLQTMTEQGSGGEGKCPDCGVDLRRRYYLGVPLQACVLCGGAALTEDQWIRVQTRYREGSLPDHLEETLDDYGGYHGDQSLDEPEVERVCPDCERELEPNRMMGTGLILDECRYCGTNWFEEDELMIALNLL